MNTAERVGWCLLAVLSPFILFLFVQLATYAYLTAKYRFEQSHKPKERLTDGDEQP
jgi:hypothetical protein